tara:strand:+ start:2197 stop:2841 length:645 start_codon:yes stop_codon:yes gene_type:complete
MPDLKLYYSPNLNPRVAVAVARYLDSPVEYIAASPMHPDHRRAFKAINPNTLVPVLVENGKSLWETDAIACRLSQIAGSDFWPTDERMSQVQMWVSWSNLHLTRPAGTFYFERLIRPQFSDVPEDPKVMKNDMVAFRNSAGILDTLLADREWLVADRLSYADFRTATCLPFAEGAGLPLHDFPNVARWHDQLLAIDAWRDPFAGIAESVMERRA